MKCVTLITCLTLLLPSAVFATRHDLNSILELVHKSERPLQIAAQLSLNEQELLFDAWNSGKIEGLSCEKDQEKIRALLALQDPCQDESTAIEMIIQAFQEAGLTKASVDQIFLSLQDQSAAEDDFSDALSFSENAPKIDVIDLINQLRELKDPEEGIKFFSLAEILSLANPANHSTLMQIVTLEDAQRAALIMESSLQILLKYRDDTELAILE